MTVLAQIRSAVSLSVQRALHPGLALLRHGGHIHLITFN